MTGMASAPSRSMAARRRTPLVVSSEAPRTPGSRSRRFSCKRATSSAPSSRMRSGRVSRGRRRGWSKVAGSAPLRAWTSRPRRASAAATSSWVLQGLLPVTATRAPASWKSQARWAVLASRWMAMAMRRPRRLPSFRWLCRRAFRVWAWSATHSILRSPSAAREGSRMVEGAGMANRGVAGGGGGGGRPPPPPGRILPPEAHTEPHPRGVARDLQERPQEAALQFVAGREAEVVVVGDVEKLEHGDEVVALAEGPGLLEAHAPVELLVVAAEAVAAGVEAVGQRRRQGDELAGVELDDAPGAAQPP